MKIKNVVAIALASVMLGTTVMGALPVMASPADPQDPPARGNTTTAPYTPVKPAVTASGLEEHLKEYVEVDQPGAPNPKLKYTLKLGTMQVYAANGVTYGDFSKVKADSVNGQQLGTVEFTAGEVVGPGSSEKAYTVSDSLATAINALEFDRPGIYFWEITKTVEGSYPNDEQKAALLIRVDEDGGVLKAPAVSMASIDDSGMPNGDKNIKYEDVFTNSLGQLTLVNEVKGNQGSKDQYMKYTVTLTGLKEYAGTSITPAGANSVNGAAAKYGEGFGSNYNNLVPKTIDEDGNVTFEVWLKDGEMIEFPNIPSASEIKYSVKEDANTHTGYNVTNKTDGTSDTGDTVTDKPLKPEGSRVEFINEKQTATPTGVIMAVAPAFAVILIGGIGVGIILAGRGRREEDEEEA